MTVTGKIYYEFAEDFIYMSRKFGIKGYCIAADGSKFDASVLAPIDGFTAPETLSDVIDEISSLDGVKIYVEPKQYPLFDRQSGDIARATIHGDRVIMRSGRPFILPKYDVPADALKGKEQPADKPEKPKPKPRSAAPRTKVKKAAGGKKKK